MQRKTLLAIGADDTQLAALAAAAAHAGEEWEVVRTAPNPAAVFVYLRGDDRAAMASQLAREPGLAPVVAVLEQLDRAAMVRAVRAGAVDVIALPLVAADVAAVLSAIGRDRFPSRVWGVFGAAGGVGVTTAALNLADRLARDGTPTALVDLDVELGMVAQFLDLSPRFTLADVAKNATRLDAAYLSGTLHALPSSLRVLPAPAVAEEAAEITPARLRQVLGELAAAYQHTVLDLPRTLDERTLEALDRCDAVLLLLPLEVPALAAVKRLREVFGRLGYRAGKIRIIGARVGRRGDVATADAQRVLGAPLYHSLPEDPAARDAMNLGERLAEVSPRSPLAAALGTLAHKLRAGLPGPSPATHRRGLRELFSRAREA